MDWASNLFVALLLTDITGTIFFLLGALFGKTCFRNDIRLQRFLTEATLCAFFVPFVYIVLYADKRLGTIKVESNINLFYNTPLTLELNALLGCAWIGLFLVLLAYRLYRRYCWTRICRGNIPEEDEEIFKVFKDVCAGLEIGGEVSLCRNDSVDMPCITYYHGFIVILPFVHYTADDARVIFYHELCHYLNGDLYFKTIGCIAALLHVFNPVVHILLKQMDLLCEKCCDRVACEKGINAFAGNEYFQVILKMLVTDGKKERYQLLALADNKSSYERRVEYMLGYRKHGGLKKGTALILSACFLVGSSITSLAAGDGVTAAYEGLAERTSVKSTYTEDSPDITDEEAIGILSRAYDLNPEDVVMMDDDGIELNAEIHFITWTIEPKKTYMSSGFRKEEGDTVGVMVAGTPDYIEYQTGLKDPKQIMWYVEGSDVTTQDFEIKLDGRHYFFVTNLSETEDLHVEVSLAR